LVGDPLKGHTDYVWSVSYSPDGWRIVSGSNDHTIRIWDAETGTSVGEHLTGHKGSVKSVAYSPDGQYSDSKNWFTFGKIFLARPIVAQITKLNSWEFFVTKQGIVALFVPNVKILASCIDLIQVLQ